jgi:hypothetical protein
MQEKSEKNEKLFQKSGENATCNKIGLLALLDIITLIRWKIQQSSTATPRWRL